MKNIISMAIFSTIATATSLSGLYVVYNALYKQNQDLAMRIEFVHGMIKRELEFCMVSEQDEFNRIVLETATDFKITGGECLKS